MSTQTASTGTTGVTPNAPAMTLDVTEAAIGEIKKFMASEEGLPETAGLRVRDQRNAMRTRCFERIRKRC